MGQAEVKSILNKKGNWLLAREIAKELDLSIGTIFRCLAILHKNREIERERAVKVIKEKDRLRNVLGHVYAYKVLDKQEELEESFDKANRKNISDITSKKLRNLPFKQIKTKHL